MEKPLQFFDCDVLLGTPKAPIQNIEPGLSDLLGEMKGLDVRRALVRHRACEEVAPELGNELLLKEVRGKENLLPVWCITPDLFLERGRIGSVVQQMLDLGVAAAWVKPARQNYVLEPWCCGKMLSALEAHRIPLMVLWDDVTGRQLDEVLGAFPALPVILLKAPRVGRNRVLYPLLERHENLYCAVAPLYSVYRGIEDLCQTFGAARLLFGSGYPEMEGGAAVCIITYAEISEADRGAIAWGNLERLIGGVRR